MITVGSLFSGVGGIEYGLERTGGFRTIWNCEIDAYCSEVLKKHWNVPNLGDITKVKWDEVEKPDMLCGGFPCQDISWAGKGAGIEAGKRSSLWKEYAKAVRILRPRYVLVENVPALTHRGLSRVLASLAESGYDAEWLSLRASDVGAPHRRERLFIVAHTNEQRREELDALCERSYEAERPAQSGVNSSDPDSQRRDDSGDNREGGQILPPQVGKASEAFPKRDGRLARPHADAETGTAPTADSRSGRIQGNRQIEIPEFAEFAPFKDVRRIEDLQNRPDIPQPLIRGAGSRFPRRVDETYQEWSIRRYQATDGRIDRTKALGNSVVPACAEVIGRWILEMEK